MAPAVATYESRDPISTILYQVIAEHLETFLASLDDDPDAKGLPTYVQREFYDYLRCGILAHGFLRLGCDTCKKEVLLPFSCKRRGFCPSCAGRRMTQTAAHLVECVMPWVATRQWVVSVPIPLRYWMASSHNLTALVHHTVHNTIAQYYVNQAVRRGAKRHKVQAGSVTFLQRLGQPELKGMRCASVNGFSLHANTDVAAHRRNQLERLLRYTARGAVSLERLTENVNGDLLYRFTRPWSDGTCGIKRSPLELIEKLVALVPPPRAHLLHYSGCLAPNSKLRAQLIPPPRQQGAGSEEAKTKASYWSWARLLGRVFDLDMARCPFCYRGALRIISAITQEDVTTRILRHLKLASVPPPISPARLCQKIFAFDAAAAGVGLSGRCAPQWCLSAPLACPLVAFRAFFQGSLSALLPRNPLKRQRESV